MIPNHCLYRMKSVIYGNIALESIVSVHRIYLSTVGILILNIELESMYTLIAF